jgi:hypothetical protein
MEQSKNILKINSKRTIQFNDEVLKVDPISVTEKDQGQESFEVSFEFVDDPDQTTWYDLLPPISTRIEYTQVGRKI